MDNFDNPELVLLTTIYRQISSILRANHVNNFDTGPLHEFTILLIMQYNFKNIFETLQNKKIIYQGSAHTVKVENKNSNFF